MKMVIAINADGHVRLDRSCSKHAVDDWQVNRSSVQPNISTERKPVITIAKMSNVIVF